MIFSGNTDLIVSNTFINSSTVSQLEDSVLPSLEIRVNLRIIMSMTQLVMYSSFSFSTRKSFLLYSMRLVRDSLSIGGSGSPVNDPVTLMRVSDLWNQYQTL